MQTVSHSRILGVETKESVDQGKNAPMARLPEAWIVQILLFFFFSGLAVFKDPFSCGLEFHTLVQAGARVEDLLSLSTKNFGYILDHGFDLSFQVSEGIPLQELI